MSRNLKSIGLNNSNLSFLDHLYVWSVLMHPLLFFYIAHEQIMGIGGNISKILEAIVSIIVAFYFIFKKSYTIKVSSYTNIYWLYIGYSIIIGLVGYYFGYYQIDKALYYELPNQGFFNLSSIRPLTEYIITIFYFFYFVVLAEHFLSNDKIINYFFKVFLFLFFANLILGFVDLFCYYFFNIDLIHVSLIRDSSTGWRFHGLSGEPRDAFVFLIFGIGMLFLYNAWKMEKKQWLLTVTLSIIAIMLTVSVSGIIGLIISSLFITAYALSTLRIKNIVLTFIVVCLLIFFVYLNISYFSRYDKFIDGLPALYYGLLSGSYEKGIFLGQLPNIWPIFARWMEISEFNLLPTIFGTGLGSESVINLNSSDFSDNVLNPHAQVIRLFYSSGIIGSLLFIFAFYYPVFKISKIYKSKVFIYFVLLILGVSLGHRSVVIYIYLGAFIAVFKQLSKKSIKSTI